MSLEYLSRPLCKRYRCRYCGYDFLAWLPVAKRPNGAMLLQYLAAMHRDQVKPYLDRMAAGECIDTVAVEAFKVVEGEDDGTAATFTLGDFRALWF